MQHLSIVVLLLFFVCACSSPTDHRTRGQNTGGGQGVTPKPAGDFDLPSTQKLNANEKTKALDLFEHINESSRLIELAKEALLADSIVTSARTPSKELREAIQNNCNHTLEEDLTTQLTDTVNGANCPISYQFVRQISSADTSTSRFQVTKNLSKELHLTKDMSLGFANVKELKYVGQSQYVKNLADKNIHTLKVKKQGRIVFAQTMADKTPLIAKFVFLLNEDFKKDSQSTITQLGLSNSQVKLVLKSEVMKKNADSPIVQKIYLNGELISDSSQKFALKALISEATEMATE